LNVIKAGLVSKSRTSHAVGDFTWLGWTVSWPQAKTKMRANLACVIPMHLLRQWAWEGVWRNCMLSSERKDVAYRASPNIHQRQSCSRTSPTLTSQHKEVI